MADELKASPQSPALATVARMLRAARSAGDTVTIPYLGGVGTMMLGKAPEEVTEWSYGNTPLHVPQMTRIPQFKKDRAESLADTLFAAQQAVPLARMAPAAARELAPAAGALALRSAELGGMPVRGLGVIKPKGGNWLAGSVEKPIEMLKQGYVPDYARWGEGAAGVTDQAKGEGAALNKWLETKLAKYIKNEMGTPEDPIRALAEKGVIHSEVAPVDTYGVAHLGKRRTAMGFPAEGMGKSEQARAWEAAADDLIHNLPAGARLNVNTSGEGVALKALKENPWLQKVPPETMTYGVYGLNLEGETQFGHLIDELRNAVNPESGLPAHLRWKYGDLEKVTVPQAVQRVHDINEWRAAQKFAADQARANNAAAVLHKDYPDAPYKWVELKAPERTAPPEGFRLEKDPAMWGEGNPGYRLYNRTGKEIGYGETEKDALAYLPNKELEDALKYEGESMGHCVGGYCPDVLEGRSRIFSLRNKKTGEPHVTIETSPGSDDPLAEVFRQLPREEQLRIREAALGAEAAPMDKFLTEREAEANRALVRNQMLKENPAWAELKAPERVVQIKGKANRAPKEEYLPFVQDFVKSGKWSDVGDLSNAGLRHTRDAWNEHELKKIRDAGYEVPDYLSPDEIQQLGEKVWPGQWGKVNYAEGGLVEGATEYNPLEVDHIVEQHRREFATGGLVTQQAKAPFNEFSMSYDINPVEIGHAEGGLLEYGQRHGKNELKGKGYFGELRNEAGGVSTELSAEDDDIGDYPLIVPSLTRSELKSLLANYEPSAEIYQKARAHAIRRKGEGLSPYAQRGELRLPKPEGFAEGGSVETGAAPYNEAKISSLVNALREELNA